MPQGRIPQNYIQEVIDRNDVVDVVQSYVSLRHRGRTYTGLCPFHNEKTPSFVVYPETQSFYCFGCGTGGSTITFIEKINNLGYVEAVRFLAARVGMPLPEEDDKASRMRQRILDINRDAARFFFASLNSQNEQAAQARAYWHRRQLADGTIRRFGLGYAPDSFHALKAYLNQRGYSDEELVESGLCRRSQKGNVFDTFRNRVITPIMDLRGNVIAFGGRVLDDSKPKYINSPETMVYKKSKTLFALNTAIKSKSRQYILCEGYMDVISMHQAGFSTAICACGTALTPEQVKLISQYADRVVLAYDSDEAGRKATARSLELFRDSPVEVSVLDLPGAKDPDEFIKANGAAAFSRLLEGSANGIEYHLARLKEQYDLATDSGRLGYIRDAMTLLASGLTPTERDIYCGRLSEETNVTRQALVNQLEATVKRVGERRRRQKQKDLQNEMVAAQIKVPYTEGGNKALAAVNAEQQLLTAMLKEPGLIPKVKEQLQAEELVLPEDRRICQVIYDCDGQGVQPSLAVLGSLLEEKELTAAAQFLARNENTQPDERDIALFIGRIKKHTALPQAPPQTSDEMRRRFEAQLKAKTER